MEADVLKKHNIAKSTLMRWKQKYRGPDVSEARRLKELERENGRLRRAVSDMAPAQDVMGEELEKKVLPASG